MYNGDFMFFSEKNGYSKNAFLFITGLVRST